jgi:hypothetical protein
MDFDLVIRGGTIVDGTGRPGVRGDVGIRDGRIVAVGEAKGTAAQTVDAGGLVVAPGFIDVHTHYDAQVMWDRMLTISPWHGVTTVVMGNCGFGVAPTRPDHRGLIMRTLEKVEGMSLAALEAGLGEKWPFETFPEYLDAVERRGTALNVAVLLGHTPLRLYVMGEEATERPATDDEIARMRALVREAIDAGAIGFATSKASTHIGYAGKPVPSRAAQFAEIEALAGALGDAGRGIVQATVGRDLFFKEFESLARSTGRPVTWTALLAGMMGPGSHRELLEKSRALIKQGLQVVPQVTCRTLNFEFQFKEPFIFESMSVFKPISVADFAGKVRLYGDPEFRRAFKESFDRPRKGAVFAGLSWARTWISWYPPDPSLEERTVDPGRAVPDGGLQPRRGRGGRAARRARCGAGAVRRGRAREPALRRLLLDLPAEPLGAGEAGDRAAGGDPHAHLAAGGGVRHHRPGAPRSRPRGRCRDLRPGHRGSQQAAARARPAGGGRSPGVRRQRHRGGDRERHDRPARRARRGRGGRRAAGGPAAQRPRESDEPSSLSLS